MKRSGEARRPAARRLLVVDDSDAGRRHCAELLLQLGYAVDTASDGRSALTLLEEGAAPVAVLLDVQMRGLSGFDVLRAIRERHGGLPVVMVSSDAQASTIVEAMRHGASDFLAKPLVPADLEDVMARVLARVDAGDQRADASLEKALWRGPSLAKVRALLDQIGGTDVTVLIQGESGTGKEVVARELHARSRRASGPFVKVNCAALPGELLESELFGHEKGAFTGAVARKAGKFEIAHGGAIFLDEIGEMSPSAQAKLLHVLQDASFSRLGGNQEIGVDVRVIAATHRSLQEMAAEKRFREDLYFRLDVVTVNVPPLRDRRDEIPALVGHFLERYGRRYGRSPQRPSPELMRLLQRHPFPGNVRELENLVKRIVVLGSEEPIIDELIRAALPRSGRAERLEALLAEFEASAGERPLREVGRLAALEAERAAIAQVLTRTNWNRRRAAKLLGVSYKTLLQKIRECDLAA